MVKDDMTPILYQLVRSMDHMHRKSVSLGFLIRLLSFNEGDCLVARTKQYPSKQGKGT